MTAEFLARCIARLVVLRLANAPSTEKEIATMMESWAEYLDDFSDDDLKAALRAHVDSSRWWPTPADLRALRPNAPSAPTPEQLWDRIMERIRCPGHYMAQDGSQRVAFGDLLDADQQAALRSIGGARAIQLADNPWTIKELRAQWLRAVQGGTVTQLRRVAS